MRFSHLFILKLRSSSRWSMTSWFGLWTSLTFGSLTFCFSICWPLIFCLYLCILWPPWAFESDVTSSEVISSISEKPLPTSTFQGRNLPVLFAKPTPTSTHCKAIIYRYPIVRDNAQHNTRYQIQHSTRCRLEHSTMRRLQHSTRWCVLVIWRRWRYLIWALYVGC